jgi:hypothetical protein
MSVELYDNNFVTFYHQSGFVNLRSARHNICRDNLKVSNTPFSNELQRKTLRTGCSSNNEYSKVELQVEYRSLYSTILHWIHSIS